MSISLSRYVDITSNVAGASAVVTRQLIGRFFTGNNLLPPQTILEFTDAADVGSYFGTYSEEYYRALFYFSWISKENTYPQAIQYARWVNTAVAPMVFPIPATPFVLASWTSVSAGALKMSIGGTTYQITSIDFSGASSAADVASILTSAINGIGGATTMWTDAVVSYVTTGTGAGFQFVGGETIAATISVAAPTTGTDITGLLGWVPGIAQSTTYSSTVWASNAIYASGSAVETVTTTLTNSAAASNDFGSFGFLNNLALTTLQITQAATWNNGENVMYMYCVPVTSSNYSAVSTAVNSLQGTQLTLALPNVSTTGTISDTSNTITNLVNALSTLQVGMTVTSPSGYVPLGTVVESIIDDNSITVSITPIANGSETLNFATTQFPEEFPMMIMASTNYLGLNTVQNYMFQQVAGLQSLVTTDSATNTYDAIAVNYYGQTQTAGNQISFYQRGLMQGSAVVTNITDMTAYANEVWLKDAIGVAIMNLLLSQTQVAANNYGRSQLLTVLQGAINQALNNGTISVGKQLNSVQIAYITTATNDPDAWYQVQNSGYWVDVVIAPIPDTSPTQYQATYTLIYSKDDVIRLVVGSDILI